MNDFNDIGKVNRSFTQTYDISIWGSSTAYMNINPKTITDSTNQTAYNFGISGAAFDQLFHLENYSNQPSKKVLLWVVNPYEFENYDYKLDETEMFIHWANNEHVSNGFQRKNKLHGLSLKWLSFNALFHLNAKHWNYIINPNIDIQPSQNGFIGRERNFHKDNNFYPRNKFSAETKRVELFQSIANKIGAKNQLIVIIPPAISAVKFNSFIASINSDNYEIWDFSNDSTFQDTSFFQDYVHLNTKGADIFSKAIASKIKFTLSQ